MHLAVEGRGLPVRVLVTFGTRADCTQALALLEGFAADSVLADRGYQPVEKLVFVPKYRR